MSAVQKFYKVFRVQKCTQEAREELCIGNSNRVVASLFIKKVNQYYVIFERREEHAINLDNNKILAFEQINTCMGTGRSLSPTTAADAGFLAGGA